MKTNLKNSLVWLLLPAMLLVNTGCEDEKKAPVPESKPEAVVNERLLNASTLASGVKDIQYNADKQPKTFFAAGMKVDVSYAKDNVVYSYYGKELLAKKVYDLQNGLVKNLTEYNYLGKVEEKGFSTSFEYQDGKMIKEITTIKDKPFGHTEYTYDAVHKNLAISKSYDHSGNLLTTTTYEYTDKLDKSGSHNEWYIWLDGTLFPKKALYLVKKISTEDHLAKKKWNVSYEYDIDAQGYVVSGKGTRDNGSSFEWTNTWQ
jgi:hypothetical protein